MREIRLFAALLTGETVQAEGMASPRSGRGEATGRC
jgi:hypothetical protein